MSGSRALSGSLRNHASNATKSRSQIFTKTEPRIKKETFVGDDSSDSSSDSESNSDSDAKDESTVDFHKRVSTPSSKGKINGATGKDNTKVFKTATPAKSPTVNGLSASATKKGKPVGAKHIKKEDSSSSSESGSDSESSSDEKTKKMSAKGKPIKKEGSSSASESGGDSESSSDDKTRKTAAKGKQSKKSESSSGSSSETETSSSSESESESDQAEMSKSTTSAMSPSKAKPPAKEAAKTAAKATAPVKRKASPGSETSSTESESESEDDGSEDPSQQIEEQIRNDLKSAESQPSQSQAQEHSKKKVKRTKPVSEAEDDDIEMMDQSMALTNGGNPTNVGDVLEFVAPDFHLRKLEGDSSAADVAKFFSKAQLEGKQVWYITAPASLPVTVVQDLSIPMDQAQQGLPVLSHNGDDYGMAFDNPSASSSFRLLIPNKKGNEYSLLEHPVNQTMHFTRSETFPPGGPSSVITTQTISTTKPARPQPEGLRARYTPLGVPAPKAAIAPPNKAVASSAADATSTPSKSASKKKRKHTDDGEDGSVATAITTPVPTQSKDAASGKKNPPAEKSAKKQKTSRQGTPRKETPVPVPVPMAQTQINSGGYGGSKSNSFTSASQPLARSRTSMSPGAALPATQVPARLTPVPLPAIPTSTSSDGVAPNSRETTKEREKQAKKAEKDRKKAEKEAAKATRSPRKVSSSQIPAPRFDSRGRPMF